MTAPTPEPATGTTPETFEGHTAGPWVWKAIGVGCNQELLLWGEHSDRPIVLDFVRKGMQGAAPRVRVDGIMQPFDRTHPDVRLIAAAPTLLQRIADLEAERDRYLEWCDKYKADNAALREKIERDPVWFVPDKIVAHAGQCFKLRVDDNGPRIVIEKVAKVSVRNGTGTRKETT